MIAAKLFQTGVGGFVVLGIFLWCSAARPAPPTQPAGEVESLVRQLSSDDGVARQRASARLVEIGAGRDDIAPRLERLVREGGTAGDPEAVARARAALESIAENRLAGPTPVTLHLHDVAPPAAFAALGAQLRRPMGPEPENLWSKKRGPAVSLDATGAPFWEVMLELCRKTGVEPDFSDNGRFKYVESLDGKWAASPSRAAGPVLMQAARLTRKRTLEFADPANAEQTCQLTFNAYLEPKVRLLSDTLPVAIESAVDEAGRSLLADDAEDPAFLPTGESTREWEGDLNLTLPARVGRKIASLKGAVTIRFPVRVETLDVSDILTANNVGRSVAGRRVIVEKAYKVKGGYEARVTLFRDQLDDAVWKEWRSPRDFVELTDAAGRSILFTGARDSNDAEGQTTLTLQFENPNNQPSGVGGPVGPPAHLVWQVPVEVREVRWPFEFRDLPLQ